MKVCTVRIINDALEYFGFLSNGKLSQEQMANFVIFEVIYKFKQKTKDIQSKLPWLSQQSTLAGNSEPIQFEIPQTKSPIQSSLVSQSPWLTLHGLALEQQDHTLSQPEHWRKISLKNILEKSVATEYILVSTKPRASFSIFFYIIVYLGYIVEIQKIHQHNYCTCHQ